MKNISIIPRLDIKGPNLVKGIHIWKKAGGEWRLRHNSNQTGVDD